MGYSATGTVTFTFSSVEQADAAAQALLEEGIGTGWSSVTPKTFMDVMSNVWDAMQPETEENGNITYSGYVVDKWVDDCSEFGPVVAPFVVDLSGEFNGEDDAHWGWRKREDGSFEEFGYEAIPDYDFKWLNQDSEAVANIIDAIKSGDDAAILRIAKINAISRMDPQTLATLIEDPDEQVRAAVNSFIIDNA